MRLFAERGFRATTVGDIEAAAGLVPRSGGLYKHFPSKRALFEEAVERHIRGAERIERIVDLLPVGDLRSELTLLARYLMGELSSEREVVVLIEKDGATFPELRDRFFREVVQRGYRYAVQFAERWLKSIPGGDAVDADALASLAVGTIVAYRRTEWTFGGDPLDVDEERFVQTFVNVFALLAGRQGGSDG
ncbi:MAG: TetR/AcrR family transcriptional regulator [Candidatus Binatia bacterium]